MAKNILRMSIITKSAFYPISSLCRNDAMLAEASLKFSAIAGLLVSLAYLRDVAVGWRQLLQRRRQSNSNQRLWIHLHSSTYNIINSIQHTVTLAVNSSLCRPSKRRRNVSSTLFLSSSLLSFIFYKNYCNVLVIWAYCESLGVTQ